MNYFIGVDVGTTSTKAVLYDEHTNVIKRFSQSYPSSATLTAWPSKTRPRLSTQWKR